MPTSALARSVPPLVAVVGLYACSFAILRSAAFATAPTVMSAGIALDLTLTASALVWWLGVRRAGWPRWTIAATFGAGLFAGRTVLPGSIVVTALVGLWLAAEAIVAVLALSRIRTIVRVARGHAGAGPIAAVEAGLVAAGAPPRFAAIAATDAVAVGLGLGGWFRRAPTDGFAMHRRKSWTAIALVLIHLIAAETIAVHVVVATWSPIAAWIATVLSIYAGVWIAADLHALRLYPLRVTATTVNAAVGLRWRITIPRDAITSVTLADAVPDGALDASVLEPTVVIGLARPIEVRGLFGIRRTPSVIALTVDDPERLIATLSE